MHILVVNDDGPPSVEHSPYVYALVRALRAAGHKVSVCLPHVQRSWIGKAHFIGQRVTPTYYRPGPGTFGEGGKTYEYPGPWTTGPARADEDGEDSRTKQPLDAESKEEASDEWVLVDAAPATCTQLGLFHLFRHRPPIDLVLSGPNFGRNSTAIYSLSSGTLGGALEAATCNKRAIALSFAFDRPRNEDPAVLDATVRHSVRLVEHLCANWGEGVDLYSINVPIRPNVENEKVMITWVLQNRWEPGESSYRVVDMPNATPAGVLGKADSSADKTESEAKKEATDYVHRLYEWGPSHHAIRRGVAESAEGSDGLVLSKGWTSVTPLKASLWEVPAHPMGELKLRTSSLPKLVVHIAYEDSYVQDLIVLALNTYIAQSECTSVSTPPTQSALSSLRAPYLQITPYEWISHESLLQHRKKYFANSYTIRKALIRKHHLAATISHYRSKHPDDCLGSHFPLTLDFEVDYAEFLDEALMECYELHESWTRNAEIPPKDREWWILKPGMSDRGQGIRLFSSEAELQAIFEEWEAANPESDHEDEARSGEESHPSVQDNTDEDDGLMASQLRHFVVQPYLSPLLLPEGPHAHRKFHLRTYVLAVGAIRVFVHKEPLALFAPLPYDAPGVESTTVASKMDLRPHLTNTCLQDLEEVHLPATPSGKESTLEEDAKTTQSSHDGPVALFNTLPLPQSTLDSITSTIHTCTASLFRAGASMPTYFQPLPNAFEIFGVDWLVDSTGKAWLLEVNAFPDFRQSGSIGWGVVRDVWNGAMSIVLKHMIGIESLQDVEMNKTPGFVQVLNLDMRRD